MKPPSNYVDCTQRWFLIKCKKAQSRESQIVNKRFLKNSEQEYKSFMKLCRQSFSNRKDAIDAVCVLTKSLKHTTINDIEILEIKHREKPGKPAKDVKPKRISFSITGSVYCSVEAYQTKIGSKGFFILATNDTDKDRLSPAEALAEYKG